MKELNNKELKKLQQIEIEILSEFDRICRKHDLNYCLIGGTLIGAIRHDGFIPWDDDIDVGMKRSDYIKFLEIQKKELDKKKYYFQTMETEDKYGLCFGKLRRRNSIYAEETSDLDIKKQGIWIDVFPIDYISNNKFIRLIDFSRIFYYRTIIYFKCRGKYASKGIKKIIFNIIKFISIFYTLNCAKKRYNSIISRQNKNPTNYVVNHGGVYILREIVPKNYLLNTTEHVFENKLFMIPKKYDQYLTRIYGDYMKLPPKEKQKSHHLVYKIEFPDK